jgi:hypothetical protein
MTGEGSAHRRHRAAGTGAQNRGSTSAARRAPCGGCQDVPAVIGAVAPEVAFTLPTLFVAVTTTRMALDASPSCRA